MSSASSVPTNPNMFFKCFCICWLQAYNGSDVGMFEFGTTVTVSCMFAMLSHMAIEAKSWVSADEFMRNIMQSKSEWI